MCERSPGPSAHLPRKEYGGAEAAQTFRPPFRPLRPNPRGRPSPDIWCLDGCSYIRVSHVEDNDFTACLRRESCKLKERRRFWPGTSQVAACRDLDALPLCSAPVGSV